MVSTERKGKSDGKYRKERKSDGKYRKEREK